MIRRLFVLTLAALLSGCDPAEEIQGTEDTDVLWVDDTGTEDVEDPVVASCVHGSGTVCSNLLDERQVPYFCNAEGDVELDGECPREDMLGACIGIGVEYVYLAGHPYEVEYLRDTCDNFGTWVWE